MDGLNSAGVSVTGTKVCGSDSVRVANKGIPKKGQVCASVDDAVTGEA